MQPSTPTRLVSGTIFEATQLLRPHPKVRPVSAEDQSTATPGSHRWSKSFPPLDADSTTGSPHLYTSCKQYEVASSRTLGSIGRFDSDVAEAGSSATPQTSSPLTPKSMALRVKGLFTAHSNETLGSLNGEKEHGKFCRARNSVQLSLRRNKRTVAEASSHDVLRSGFYSHIKEYGKQLETSGTSTILHDPPQIAPLRPVSKFLPTLSISIPDNELSSSMIAEHGSSKTDDDDEVESEGNNNDRDSLNVAPLRPRSSNLTFVPYQESSAAETSFYYTAQAQQDDDVFTPSDETSRIDRPVSNFDSKLRAAMQSTHGIKTPSVASASSQIVTPSPSPKLRHASPKRSDLRSQFAATRMESSSPPLYVPKVRKSNRVEIEKTVRLAPSLEEGLRVDDVQVYEESATAAAAPIVRNVEPNVVDIQGSRTLETTEQCASAVPKHQHKDSMEISRLIFSNTNRFPPPPSVMVAPLNVAPKRNSDTRSSARANSTVCTMPLPVLETIVFSAAYGDKECRDWAAGLYKAVIEADITNAVLQWGAREQRLLRQSNLMQELDSLVRFGYLPEYLFTTIRGQIFPTRNTELMENRDFENYIWRAVRVFALTEDRAKQVLELAAVDQSFQQSSLEEEVFFEREPFNSQGYAYGDSIYNGSYERLGSLPSTIVTYDSAEPLEQEQQQQQSGWRPSYIWTKVVQMFRVGPGKQGSQAA